MKIKLQRYCLIMVHWKRLFSSHWKHSLKRNRQEDCQYEMMRFYISSWLHQLCRKVMHGWPHWSLLGWHCVMFTTYVHIVLFWIISEPTCAYERWTFQSRFLSVCPELDQNSQETSRTTPQIPPSTFKVLCKCLLRKEFLIH